MLILFLFHGSSLHCLWIYPVTNTPVNNMLRQFMLLFACLVLVQLVTAARLSWLLPKQVPAVMQREDPHRRLNKLFAVQDDPNLDIRTNVLLNMEGI